MPRLLVLRAALAPLLERGNLVADRIKGFAHVEPHVLQHYVVAGDDGLADGLRVPSEEDSEPPLALRTGHAVEEGVECVCALGVGVEELAVVLSVDAGVGEPYRGLRGGGGAGALEERAVLQQPGKERVGAVVPMRMKS